MPRPKTAFVPAKYEPTLPESEPTELPPPGPNIYSFRAGEGGGKIQWQQRAYSYTIDPQDNQVVITVSLRPAQ